MFFAPSKSRQRAEFRIMVLPKISDHIQIKIKMPNSSQEPQVSSKALNQEFKDMMFFAPTKSSQRAKIKNMGVPKTSYHIKINIRMQNPSQEPPSSSSGPNEDFKDMDILCTFKIKIESQKLIMGMSKTSDHIQMKMPNSSREPPVFPTTAKLY